MTTEKFVLVGANSGIEHATLQVGAGPEAADALADLNNVVVKMLAKYNEAEPLTITKVNPQNPGGNNG